MFKKFRLKGKLLLLALVPLFLLGIIAIILSSIFIKSGMENEILRGLQASASFYADTKKAVGRGYKDNEFEDELKEQTGYDFTWFDGDTRVNTSIVEKNGSRPIGTKASEKAIAECLKGGNIYTSVDVDIAGHAYCVAYIPVKDAQGNITSMAFAGSPKGSVEATVKHTILIICSIIFFIMILCVLAVLLITNRMTTVIKSSIGTVVNLSNGKFISNDAHSNRSDELGDLSKGTNSLIHKLKEIILGINTSTSNITENSSVIHDIVQQVNDTIDSVNCAVEDIATGATSQAQDVQDVSDSVKEISVAIQNVVKTTEHLGSITNKMEEHSRKSEKELQELKDSSEIMGVSIEEVQARIGATGSAVDAIYEKVNVINDIASQTNLLSLNASIEAARAGDMGRGFAVVADEIRQLADSSAKAAQEIQTEMIKLRKEAESAVEQSEIVSENTRKQQRTLEETIYSIRSLISDIAEDIKEVHIIAEDAESCNKSKQVVLDAVTNLSAVAEENAASSEETSASMVELGSTIENLASSAEQLKVLAEALQKDISFFELD